MHWAILSAAAVLATGAALVGVGSHAGSLQSQQITLAQELDRVVGMDIDLARSYLTELGYRVTEQHSPLRAPATDTPTSLATGAEWVSLQVADGVVIDYEPR